MTNKTLQQFYDDKYEDSGHASSIPEIRRTSCPRDRLEAAIHFFPKFFGGGDVLEVAAGSGSVAKALLASDTGIKSYTLGDLSLPRMEGIRRNLRDERVRFLEIDAENINEGDQVAYDGILMIALIEHLVDPLSAMKSIRGLLKPGGILYLDTPNIAKWTRRALLLAGKFPSTASTDEGLTTYWGKPVELHEEGHLHYFTYRSLSRMLVERCGFSGVVKLGYACGRMPLGGRVHSKLANVWPEMFSELALVAYA